jgi:predicted permease
MAILNIVLPVFLVIGLGYGLRRGGFLGGEAVSPLSRLVFHVAAPILLFRSAARTPLGRSAQPEVLLLVAGISVATALLGYVLLGRSEPARRGVLAQGTHRSNMVFFGLPVVANAYGEEALGLAAVLVGFMVMLYNLLAVLLLTLPHRERSARSAAVWGRTALAILRNPLIVGSGLGILASATGVVLPVALDQALDLVGRIALPLALIALGAGLDLGHLRAEMRPALLVGVVKLAIYPGLVLAGLRALGLTGQELAVPVLVMASPTAVVSYIMAREMHGDERLAGAIVIGTTLAALPATVGWLLYFL